MTPARAPRRRPVPGAGQRGTLLWLLVLTLALLGIGWQLRHAPAPVVHDDEAPAEALIPQPLADWRSVELLWQGRRQRFERDAAGQWFRHDTVAGEAAGHGHTTDPAAAARLADALATFSRARIERSLPRGDARLASYGLDNPPLLVLVQGDGGRLLQTLALGDLAPDGLSRYAHLPQANRVVTLPDYQARGLLGLVVPASASATASAP